MPQLTSFLRLARALLAYPTQGQEAVWAQALQQLAGTEAEASLAATVNALERMSLADREETYVRTFDLDPKAALEVGWHLYGEDYKRGEFLATCRALLRQHGIPEAGELPDHLGSLLAFLAALPEDARCEFYESYLRPALASLVETLVARQSPYAGMLRALAWAAEQQAASVAAGGGR